MPAAVAPAAAVTPPPSNLSKSGRILTPKKHFDEDVN
jgi:hypothetical protein